jgi:hypothetical protein
MSTLTIKTNNQYRQTITWNDLSAKEQKEFDYLETDEEQQEAIFIKYRGVIYNMSEFMRISAENMKGWHGGVADTFFSGVLIKINDEGDVCMGHYYS